MTVVSVVTLLFYNQQTAVFSRHLLVLPGRWYKKKKVPRNIDNFCPIENQEGRVEPAPRGGKTLLEEIPLRGISEILCSQEWDGQTKHTNIMLPAAAVTSSGA